MNNTTEGKILDKNHTTFIITDGDENEFRKNFEEILNQETPVILVLIQGDAGALEDVLSGIERQIPILIVVVRSYKPIF